MTINVDVSCVLFSRRRLLLCMLMVWLEYCISYVGLTTDQSFFGDTGYILIHFYIDGHFLSNNCKAIPNLIGYSFLIFIHLRVINIHGTDMLVETWMSALGVNSMKTVYQNLMGQHWWTSYQRTFPLFEMMIVVI